MADPYAGYPRWMIGVSIAFTFLSAMFLGYHSYSLWSTGSWADLFGFALWGMNLSLWVHNLQTDFNILQMQRRMKRMREDYEKDHRS